MRTTHVMTSLLLIATLAGGPLGCQQSVKKALKLSDASVAPGEPLDQDEMNTFTDDATVTYIAQCSPSVDAVSGKLIDSRVRLYKVEVVHNRISKILADMGTFVGGVGLGFGGIGVGAHALGWTTAKYENTEIISGNINHNGTLGLYQLSEEQVRQLQPVK